MSHPSEILTAIMMVSCLSLGVAPEAREWTAPDGKVVKYRWSAPETVEAGKTYPLILFLHGSGERGMDNAAQLKHGVNPILDGAKKLDQPVFLIAPQCPPDRWWSPINSETMQLSEAEKPNDLLESLVALVDDTIKKSPVDAKRFYVTGISMGGFATWDLLGRIPRRIAAAIPVCGGGDPSLAGRFREVPIWAFHGEADPVVPVRTTREMIEFLEKAGGTPKATYYPQIQHESWVQTYSDPELIRWMFDQRLK